jgi:4-amino-4-deoxy-L-arabinose transferase-like glycosyltransferase
MKGVFSWLSERTLGHGSARIVLLAAAWLLLTAGLRPLMLPDEGRYAGIAWEMLSSGNWLVPTLDGMPFFHKPPLFYWLTAAGLQIFGLNEWAARLASTSSAILAAVALYLFARKHADRPTANLALVVLVTQPFFYGGAQFANLDMLVASMIAVTIIAGADAILDLERQRPHRRSLALAYLFAALGVLAKGLIGFVLPGAILLAWLVVRRKFRLIPALFPLSLLLLFFAVAAPWFLWMQKSYGGFWDYFFVYHHFRRFAETGFNNQQAFWFYIPVLLLATLPWSPWIFRLGSRGFLKDSGRFAVRSLMLLWLLGILAFFSLPKSKLVGYILPALPAFAYLIADLILHWQRAGAARHPQRWVGLCMALAAALCLAVVVAVARLDPSGLQGFAKKAGKLPDDAQLVMLDEYQYDLPFYLGLQRMPWVISNWQDPSIPKNDNWRKELYDAGLFDTERMQHNLISAAEFSNRLCAEPQKTFWLWGKTEQAARYPFVDPQAVVFAHGKRTLWRLDAADRERLKLCDGRPRNG